MKEPTSIYARKIWFLYEWLLGTRLHLADAEQGNYTPIVNTKLQYAGPITKVKRQRVDNNLPGNVNFCPLVRRTEKLETFVAKNLSEIAAQKMGACHPDVLSRAAAFLLLADSKASYMIEGEQPSPNRIQRWGRVIAQAGQAPLTLEELERLQDEVIADYRFVMPGFRLEGGFVGHHDRVTGLPLPEHISAKAQDLGGLMQGFLQAYQQLIHSDYPPVLLAAALGFGFVFIHPFEDGNGRLHRYLLHHFLAASGFVKPGVVFPVSAVILERITQYKAVLEAFSKPRLAHIEWKPTLKNNIEVTNDTMDLYRYFDATQQAEFLYECVEQTIQVSLPQEVDYLTRYDRFVTQLKAMLELPDVRLNLLLKFLQQNAGRLSKRALEKEFSKLTFEEVEQIERLYASVFQRYSSH
ncbi:Fic family protein [Thiomicrospira sp. WB1]|uniref:Fic family protein n=1 Tax=Thiomicrospira sp. WB1 TaxID=1685380 RepID=UPI0013665B27|nr:Fic family protein [Thiomicrospira sp. WB1]